MTERDEYGSVEDVQQALGLGRPAEASAEVEPRARPTG